MMRLPTYGGNPEPVEITSWNYGAPTGTLSVALTNAEGEPVTARVSISHADGHPVAYSGDATYVDPQTGRHYFYIEDSAEFTLPEGPLYHSCRTRPDDTGRRNRHSGSGWG